MKKRSRNLVPILAGLLLISTLFFWPTVWSNPGDSLLVEPAWVEDVDGAVLPATLERLQHSNVPGPWDHPPSEDAIRYPVQIRRYTLTTGESHVADVSLVCKYFLSHGEDGDLRLIDFVQANVEMGEGWTGSAWSPVRFHGRSTEASVTLYLSDEKSGSCHALTWELTCADGELNASCQTDTVDGIPSDALRRPFVCRESPYLEYSTFGSEIIGSEVIHETRRETSSFSDRATSATAAGVTNQYFIHVPYAYPVRPETAGWTSLNT